MLYHKSAKRNRRSRAVVAVGVVQTLVFEFEGRVPDAGHVAVGRQEGEPRGEERRRRPQPELEPAPELGGVHVQTDGLFVVGTSPTTPPAADAAAAAANTYDPGPNQSDRRT